MAIRGGAGLGGMDKVGEQGNSAVPGGASAIPGGAPAIPAHATPVPAHPSAVPTGAVPVTTPPSAGTGNIAASPGAGWIGPPMVAPCR